MTEEPINHKFLKHLGLWEEEIAWDPPSRPDIPETVLIPIENTGWDYPDQPDFMG